MTDFTLINADNFQPFVLHKRHEPVPIAMVNRAPHGSKLHAQYIVPRCVLMCLFTAPGHQDVDVPQNVAWLSGIRLAQKSVFMYVITLSPSHLAI